MRQGGISPQFEFTIYTPIFNISAKALQEKFETIQELYQHLDRCQER